MPKRRSEARTKTTMKRTGSDAGMGEAPPPLKRALSNASSMPDEDEEDADHGDAGDDEADHGGGNIDGNGDLPCGILVYGLPKEDKKLIEICLSLEMALAK